jgi:hypothetical protein
MALLVDKHTKIEPGHCVATVSRLRISGNEKPAPQRRRVVCTKVWHGGSAGTTSTVTMVQA